MIGYYCFVVIVTIIDVMMLNTVLPDINSSGYSKDLMRTIIAALIWVPYFLKSERVRFTFEKEFEQLDKLTDTFS